MSVCLQGRGRGAVGIMRPPPPKSGTSFQGPPAGLERSSAHLSTGWEGCFQNEVLGLLQPLSKSQAPVCSVGSGGRLALGKGLLPLSVLAQATGLEGCAALCTGH